MNKKSKEHSPAKYLVTQELLDLHDKYDEELSLMWEPWGCKKDRKKDCVNYASFLYEYIDKLLFLQVENLSNKLREEVEGRILELERVTEPKVIAILRSRTIQKNK